MPESRDIVEKLSRQLISRGEAEAERIRTETDPIRLLKRLGPDTDAINFNLLTKRLLEYEDIVTPVLLEKLAFTEDDVFIERSARYFNHVAKFPEDTLIYVVEKVRNPYVQSVLCVLFGAKGSEAVLPIIWKYYHLFRESREGKLAQGPLFGLYEYGRRYDLLK